MVMMWNCVNVDADDVDEQAYAYEDDEDADDDEFDYIDYFHIDVGSIEIDSNSLSYVLSSP